MSNLLQQVRDLKLRAVKHLMSGCDSQIEKDIVDFLAGHRYQVLDIIDDALTAYEGGR